jgi:alanine dehydrogenase
VADSVRLLRRSAQGEGVRFADVSGVWSAPLVLHYKCTDPDDLALLTSRQSIGALFHAEGERRRIW